MGKCGTLPIFLSDVNARHDKMVGMVETMQMTADGLQPTVCGLGRTRRQKHTGAVSREPYAEGDQW
jgi:hypothetical protein